VRIPGLTQEWTLFDVEYSDVSWTCIRFFFLSFFSQKNQQNQRKANLPTRILVTLNQENLASALAGEAAQMVMARNWLSEPWWSIQGLATQGRSPI